MRSIHVLCAVAFALAVVAGCKKSDAGSSNASAGTATAAAGELGVAECDAYMTKYMKCVDAKAPKEAKDQMKQAFEAQKTAWKQAAATAEGKKALADACKQADSAAKAAMSAYGCEW
jgi:hypothetical protein